MEVVLSDRSAGTCLPLRRRAGGEGRVLGGGDAAGRWWQRVAGLG